MSPARSSARHVALPRLDLAAVVDEVAGVEPPGDGGERAAGFDLGELAVVTDEYDLRVGLGGVVEEPGELAGSDHGGFVDDDDVAIGQPGCVGTVEVDE